MGRQELAARELKEGLMRAIGIFIFAVCVVTARAGQADHLVYSLPAANRVIVQQNIEYRKVGDRALKFDLYRLPVSEKPAAVPVVLIFNDAFGRADFKAAFFQREWAKMCAAAGFAAVSYDAHKDGWAEDVDALMQHLREHKTALALDPETVILRAASGLAFNGLPLAMDKNR